MHIPNIHRMKQIHEHIVLKILIIDCRLTYIKPITARYLKLLTYLQLHISQHV